MHWTFGVTFREDDSRTRERTLANNLSWLRRFAVTLLKRHPIDDSRRGKTLRCGSNTDFLEELLPLPGDECALAVPLTRVTPKFVFVSAGVEFVGPRSTDNVAKNS
jgi:hypothetical protein